MIKRIRKYGEEERIKKRIYYLANRERKARVDKDRYYKKWNEIRAKQKEYYIKNKEAVILQVKKYEDLKQFSGKRSQVLERDKWSCTSCGMNNEEHRLKFGKEITIHHIDGKGRYSKEPNNSMDNLTTLCLVCHGRADGVRHGKKYLEITN